jgi:hypothetical protein
LSVSKPAKKKKRARLEKEGIQGRCEVGMYRGNSSAIIRGIYVEPTYTIDKVLGIFGKCPLWGP